MTLEHSLIEYPSDFPNQSIRPITGRVYRRLSSKLFRSMIPSFKASSIEMRNSKTARYVSLTCTVRATSREQLDTIYQALCDHPMVVMAL
jgi:putative lipoic acid-binding regulatory protein